MRWSLRFGGILLPHPCRCKICKYLSSNRDISWRSFSLRKVCIYEWSHLEELLELIVVKEAFKQMFFIKWPQFQVKAIGKTTSVLCILIHLSSCFNFLVSSQWWFLSFALITLSLSLISLHFYHNIIKGLCLYLIKFSRSFIVI